MNMIKKIFYTICWTAIVVFMTLIAIESNDPALSRLGEQRCAVSIDAVNKVLGETIYIFYDCKGENK